MHCKPLGSIDFFGGGAPLEYATHIDIHVHQPGFIHIELDLFNYTKLDNSNLVEEKETLLNAKL